MSANYDPEEECWEYVDPKAVRRGPFSGSRMALWFDNHMLPEDLKVRHCPSMPFLPIKELFKAPAQPFRSRPRPGPPPAPQKCNAMWQYCDTKGQLQGPFTSAQMALWYDNSMLPKTLQLRRTTDTHFATITSYFPKSLVPFQSPPVTPSMPSAKEPALAINSISLGSGTAVLNALAAAQAKVKAAPMPKAPVPARAAAQAKSSQAMLLAAQQMAASQAVPKQLDAGEVAKGGGKGGKGPVGGDKGGKGPVGAAGNAAGGKKGSGKKEAQQQHQGDQWWSEQGWSCNDKAWWESSWWNGSGWSQDGSWDHNGKQQGAEWKGDGSGGPIGATPPRERGEK
eukprot:CAMPEP_0195063710 /NCGR_PEP_ID=MMETSP0448-20130528/10013_1 /TAXON_ID=66468 /ORGANISM="Heterocapsa triquestra, Strain CCMP 448" /LENGTH=338 /DNA_ID=CAMNT_0040094643 /DNA_START=62 /DNA_END=1075 /DNA_ORIENTATION=+